MLFLYGRHYTLTIMEKTVLITGATGVIGEATARLIAKNHDYRIVLIARNESKAEQVVQQMTKTTGNPNISYLIADLSRKHEIQSMADNWHDPVHILINIAGATPRKRQETPEGIEMQWATNVLGYFWMIRYFQPFLKQAAPSRIINIASYWAGNLDLSDPEFKLRHYDNDTAYRQSKQAGRMLTVAFAERLKKDDITVNVCHPGDVHSNLSHDLGFGGHETPEQGAATPVWLATSPETEGVTGKYFEHLHETRCQFSSNPDAIEQLYKLCSSY